MSQDPIGLVGNNPTLYGYVNDINSEFDFWGLDWHHIIPNQIYREFSTAFDSVIEYAQNISKKGLDKTNLIDLDTPFHGIEPFTIEEIKKLQLLICDTYPNYNYAHRELKHNQLKLIFTVYYACGLRLSEGIRLTAKDIDFNKRTLFVRQGKNYKDRIIPLSENVYNALCDYVYNFRNLIKCGHDRLFVQPHITLSLDLKYLHRFCEDENIREKRLTFHILRHSIATHLLQNGMSVENIARFLGHNSLSSTQIYTHIIKK